MNPAAMTLDEARQALLELEQDATMVTTSKYSPTASGYADGRLPFIEIHLAYLRKNKLVSPSQYISNLAIMIKQR